MTTPDSPPPLLRTLAESQAMLRVSKSVLLRLIARGDLHTVKIGRRTYVRDDELVRYVDALTEAAS